MDRHTTVAIFSYHTSRTLGICRLKSETMNNFINDWTISFYRFVASSLDKSTKRRRGHCTLCIVYTHITVGTVTHHVLLSGTIPKVCKKVLILYSKVLIKLSCYYSHDQLKKS